MTLRPYEETDAADKCAAVRESMAELSPWMPWCHAEYSTADAAAWIRKARAGHLDGSLLDFAILDADGTYAGGCGVNRINRLDRCGNVSYWVRTSRSGRGIAREAVRQLLSWTFANTPLNRLEIVVATGNLPSQRVAERVGARRDAVLRKRLMVRGAPADAILYSVVREDG